MADERRRWIWERHRGGTAAVEEREISILLLTVQVRSTGRTEEVDPAVQLSGRFLHLRYHSYQQGHPSIRDSEEVVR
jgi:hypothetical protein